MKHFLFTAQAPIGTGNVQMQSVYSCEIFLNYEQWAEWCTEKLRQDNPEVEVTGKWILYSLIELTAEQLQIWATTIGTPKN